MVRGLIFRPSTRPCKRISHFVRIYSYLDIWTFFYFLSSPVVTLRCEWRHSCKRGSACHESAVGWASCYRKASGPNVWTPSWLYMKDRLLVEWYSPSMKTESCLISGERERKRDRKTDREKERERYRERKRGHWWKATVWGEIITGRVVFSRNLKYYCYHLLAKSNQSVIWIK